MDSDDKFFKFFEFLVKIIVYPFFVLYLLLEGVVWGLFLAIALAILFIIIAYSLASIFDFEVTESVIECIFGVCIYSTIGIVVLAAIVFPFFALFIDDLLLDKKSYIEPYLFKKIQSIKNNL